MIVLLSGLPGSGKSTLAARLRPHLAQDGLTALILSRDVLREHVFGLSMGPGDQVLRSDEEVMLSSMLTSMADAAVDGGAHHLIIDQTSRTHRSIAEWRAVADRHREDFRVVRVGEFGPEGEPAVGELRRCLAANRARADIGGRRVSEGVIRDMADSWEPLPDDIETWTPPASVCGRVPVTGRVRS